MIRKPRTEKNFTPEDSQQMTLAACLNRIFKKVEIEGLSEDAAGELAEDIRLVSEKFSISPKAAVLLAAIIEKSSCSNNCDEEDLANYIGCTNIEFIGFHEAIREMEDNGMIAVSTGRRRGICVSLETMKSVEHDCQYEPVKIAGLSTEDLFTRIRIHMCNYRKDIIDDDRLIFEIDRLVEKNPELLFCRKVMESPLGKCSSSERRMFYYLCHRYVSHGEDSVPIDILMNFTEFMEDELRMKRDISLEKTRLQQSSLVTFGTTDGFANEQALSLSDEVRANWFDEIELAPQERVNHKSLISCNDIKDQQLFYNPREEEQVERLAGLLDNDNFVKVQQRLTELGMPRGFSCLFAGGPGTGKTASLKALAKRTGRDLFWVDLSSIKSKWVGESEQNLKKVFDDYRKLARTSEKAPILAVNEADGIFTKRITNIEHSVDNMYNAMTDIVLNELETLDGILIATTNLVGNMMDEADNAMERRFLYKIEFEKPDEGVRERIWKSKIQGLSDEDAATLAERFTFSGGNIENVARKSAVDYILSGERPNLDTLVKYCEEENAPARKNDRRIGF